METIDWKRIQEKTQVKGKTQWSKGEEREECEEGSRQKTGTEVMDREVRRETGHEVKSKRRSEEKEEEGRLMETKKIDEGGKEKRLVAMDMTGRNKTRWQTARE